MFNVIKKILPNSIHFSRQAKLVQLALGSMVLLTTLDANAGEKEVWYNANGVPVLIKDKATGRMRAPTIDELVIVTDTDDNAAKDELLIEPETQPTLLKNDQPVSTPLVLNQSRVPQYLTPKVYSPNLIYRPRNQYYSPYNYGRSSYYGGYTNFPYSRQAIPQFSSNGYYRPARYYPTYPRYPHYGYYGHNHCRNGFLLQYSRPGITIRARF